MCSIMACPWCHNGVLSDLDSLCREHLAEYEGITLDELERSEHEWTTELL